MRRLQVGFRKFESLNEFEVGLNSKQTSPTDADRASVLEDLAHCVPDAPLERHPLTDFE
jgi:hypothetical protein